MSRSEAYFDEIVALIRGGMTGTEACASRPEYPAYCTIVEWATSHGRREEIMSARKERGPTGKQSPNRKYSEADWEAGLRTVATSDASSLPRLNVPGQPNLNTMRKRAARDPAFKTKLDHAFAERRKRVRPAVFEDADHVAGIRLWQSRQDLLWKDVDPLLIAAGLPTIGAIYARSRRNRAMRKLFDDANAGRDKHYRQPSVSEDQFAAALDVLAAHPTVSVAELVSSGSVSVPSRNVLHHRRSKASKLFALKAKYDAVMAHRRKQRAALRPKPVVYAEYVLQTALSRDELYREASALFARFLPDRDDMISEVVFAVLDGRLKREEIATKGAAIGWRHFNSLHQRGIDNLDFKTENGTSALDNMTADQWTFEGVA